MKGVRLLILFLFGVLFVAACAPQSSSEPASPVISQEKVMPSADVKKTWQEEWEKLIKAARKESRVVIYTTEGETRLALAQAFKQKYGIEAEFLSARPAQIFEKLSSERRAGLYLADLFVSGSADQILGIFDPLEPELILPELADPREIEKFWFEGKLQFMDKATHSILIFAAYVSVPFTINTDLVKPEEIKSYKDLLHPKWKGKISMSDATMSGPGGQWFGMALWAKIVDMDYMRRLAQQEPVMLRDPRLQIDWLARGKYPLGIATKTGVLTEFIDAKAPIKRLPAPIEGAYISAGGGNIALIKNRPHPNAARLYLNWLLTQEGQTVFSMNSGRQSRRLDVPTDHIEPIMRLVPGLKFANTDDEEYLSQKEKFYHLASEIFGHLMR